MDVDLLTGQPASPHICSTQPWRVARVKSHRLPHSSYGYAEGGKRARHQTYEFYKYYGEFNRPLAACACPAVRAESKGQAGTAVPPHPILGSAWPAQLL